MNGQEEKIMKRPRILAVGDSVCDKYLSREKMYPGGQCVNTCVYSGMNGADSAYLGNFADMSAYSGGDAFLRTSE